MPFLPEQIQKIREAAGLPADAEVFDAQDVADLRSKMGEQQGLLQQLQAQLNTLDISKMSDEDLGKNPRVKAYLDKVKKQRKDDNQPPQSDEAALEALRTALTTEHQNQLQAVTSERDFWKQDAISNRSHAVIRNAAMKNNFNDPEDAVTVLSRFVKVQEQNNDRGKAVVTVVVDDKGNPRFNAQGAPMTVEDLVAEMAKAKPWYVKGREIHGSGASGGSADGKEMTHDQQLAQIEKDYETAKQNHNAREMMRLENRRAALLRESNSMS